MRAGGAQHGADRDGAAGPAGAIRAAGAAPRRLHLMGWVCAGNGWEATYRTCMHVLGESVVLCVLGRQIGWMGRRVRKQIKIPKSQARIKNNRTRSSDHIPKQNKSLASTKQTHSGSFSLSSIPAGSAGRLTAPKNNQSIDRFINRPVHPAWDRHRLHPRPGS